MVVVTLYSPELALSQHTIGRAIRETFLMLTEAGLLTADVQYYSLIRTYWSMIYLIVR